MDSLKNIGVALAIAFIILFLACFKLYAGGVIQEGSLAASASAQSFSSVSSDAVEAIITVEGGDIRWFCESTPDANNGHILADGNSLVLDNLHDIVSFAFILKSGESGVSVNYSISGR